MPMHFFAIPAWDGARETEALNQLLASTRVVQLQREFVSQGKESFWSICIETLGDSATHAGERSGDRKGKVDYKAILDEASFARFVKLRELRKELAQADGIPVYAVCTNDQLAFFAQNPPENSTSLLKCPGWGEAKQQRYGQVFYQRCTGEIGEKQA